MEITKYYISLKNELTTSQQLVEVLMGKMLKVILLPLIKINLDSKQIGFFEEEFLIGFYCKKESLATKIVTLKSKRFYYV